MASKNTPFCDVENTSFQVLQPSVVLKSFAWPFSPGPEDITTASLLDQAWTPRKSSDADPFGEAHFIQCLPVSTVRSTVPPDPEAHAAWSDTAEIPRSEASVPESCFNEPDWAAADAATHKQTASSLDPSLRCDFRGR